MTKALSILVSLLLITEAAPVRADDIFQFLEEETKVVTASRLPQTAQSAPATTYVVTHDEIEASGAQNIWDLLRTVPGVDVIATRTGQGEVSIRGLDAPLSNRTLVLLDGKTVLNNYFDFVIWNAIPVTLDEIDRIEIVEGPASALYGPNAINGVINIITKTPEQLKGGITRYTGAERHTSLAGALYGNKTGNLGYKLGAGWNYANRFENDDLLAARATKLHGLLDYDIDRATRLSLSGGYADARTQITTGQVGAAEVTGPEGFGRIDLNHKDTRFRFFWNHGRQTAPDFTLYQGPDLNYDTYDANLEQSVSLPFENNLVLGGSFSRNTARSTVLGPGLVTQDLGSIFFEDQWKPIAHWTGVASGRLDKHPFTGWVFSPRGSVIFNPVPQHVFRFSAGTAFRNPTLLENYLNFSQTIPTGAPPPLPSSIVATQLGNHGLIPERVTTLEVAHNGKFDRLKTTVAGFYYELKNIIASGPTIPDPACAFPPLCNNQTSFVNSGLVDALGGEVGADYAITRQLGSFANYSFQQFRSAPLSSQGGPRHKVNGGLRLKSGGWTGALWADWVDKVLWNQSSSGSATDYVNLPDFILINGHIGYDFYGKWQGLGAGLSVFNLTQRTRWGGNHYETLPQQNNGMPGQTGEIIGTRWSGDIHYRF